MTPRVIAIVALMTLALAGCYREKREFQSPPPDSPPDPTKLSSVLPGDRAALQPGSQPTPDRSYLDENAYAVSHRFRPRT